MALISSGSFVAANDKTLSNTFSFVTSASLGIGNPSVLFVATDNINGPSYVWTSAAAMIVARSALAGVGTQTSALAFGGSFPNGTCTEAYNGISWSAGGAMITGGPPGCHAGIGGTGTQNAALGFGGGATLISCTECYNGTSWATSVALPGVNADMIGIGTQNAALSAGGTPIYATGTSTLAFDGSTWTSKSSMNSIHACLGGHGTQNAAMTVAGFNSGFAPSVSAATETFNGTSWTSQASIITARQRLKSAGTTTNAVAFGGQTAPFSGPTVSCTEQYNGSSWSATTAMITVQSNHAGLGTSTAALAANGSSNITQAFNSNTSYCSNTITSVIDGFTNYYFGGTSSFFDNTVRTFATQSDGKILVGGDFTTYNNVSQSYLARLDTTGSLDTTFAPTLNGPVYKIAIQPNVTGSVPLGGWSTGTNMNADHYMHAAVGVQNAALAFGSFAAPSPTCGQVTEAYNGSTWAVKAAMTNAGYCITGAGTQNAALRMAGSGLGSNTVNSYNGTSWSSIVGLINSVSWPRGAGTQNAALSFGGRFQTVATEVYNGTSWASGGNLIKGRGYLGGAGTQNAALAFGGYCSNPSAPFGTGTFTCTEKYNGTTWSVGNAMINARSAFGSGGTQNAAMAFAGTAESYNGTTWSATVAMINSRTCLAGATGGNTAAIGMGGNSFCTNTELFSLSSFATSCTCISDKIVAVGAFNVANTCISSGSARFNPDSSLDGTYNIGTGSNSTVCTVLVQPTTAYSGSNNYSYTNKLILGGTFTAISGSTSSGSVRLNGDGTVDTTFNIGAGFSGSVDVRTVAGTISGWKAGGAMITARQQLAGAGTQTAALAFGGCVASSLSCTEKYNGASWSASGTLITARCRLAGTGTQNAALAFGGITLFPTVVTCTEAFNGTSWAAGGALSTARYLLAGAGTTAAALAFGGTPAASTEKYNGTSWSAGAAMIAGRAGLAGAGTQNAAIAFGAPTCTETYDGTSWTAGGAMIVGRQWLAGAGTTAAALAFGGFPGSVCVACTEAYNGSTWSTKAAMIRARWALAGAGTQTSALAFGGYSTPVNVTCTEAYNDSIIFGGNFTSYSGSTANRIIQVDCLAGTAVTGSAFNIGTGFNDAVNSIAIQYDNNILVTGNFTQYSGSSINRLARITPTGALDTAFSASIGTGLNSTGSVVCIYPNVAATWTAGGAMSVSRNQLAGAGTQTAALGFGGNFTPSTEAYNGTSWATRGGLIQTRYQLAGAGTQNAALAFGGYSVSPSFGNVTCTEANNGTSWSAGGALIQARSLLGGAGASSNSAIAFGGNFPSFGILSCTETYNGTSWSSVAGISARQALAGAGTQNAALAFGGFPTTGATEAYNGTSWTAGGTMITARSGLAGAGTQTSALGFGSPSCTEAYNGITWSSTTSMITARGSLAGAGASSTAALAFGGSPSLACTEAYIEPNQIILGGNFTSHAGTTYSGSVRLRLGGGLNTSFNIGLGFGNTTSVNDYLFCTPSSANSAILVGGGFTTYSSSVLSPSPNRIVLLNTDGTVSGSKLPTISWNKVAEYTEATSGSISGSTIAMFYGSASATVPSNLTFVATLSGSVTAKAVTGWTFRNTNNSRALGPYVGIFTSSIDINSPQTMNLSGSLPFYGNYILSRVTAFKGPGTCTFVTSSITTPTPEAWSTGGALATARRSLAGAGASFNSSLAFGGVQVNTWFSCTEAYNGTSWSAGGALSTAREGLAGAGTQNAALAFNGSPVGNCTEAYNGTSWSSGGAMINARRCLAGSGTTNAALAFGGIPSSGTEAYNGTSWSSATSMINGRFALGGVGTQTAALAFGGYPNTAEAYDGTSWSSKSALITQRNRLAGAGTQNAALGFGGFYASVCTCTEAYNGTSWSAKSAMITAKYNLAGAGIQSAALAFGGASSYGGPVISCTEAYIPGTITTGGPFTPFTQTGTTGGISGSNMSIAGEFLASSGSDLVGIGLSTIKSQPQYSGSTSNSSIYYAICEPFSRTSLGSSN